MAKTKCPVSIPLQARKLIDNGQASDLAALFKLLGNETRLRLLHALEREKEMCVSDLAAALQMKPQAVSNQLQRLADRGIIEATRNGQHIHYRIIDPCLTSVLDHAWCLVECAEPTKRRAAS